MAILWTKLVIAVDQRKALRSAFLDLVLMTIGASAYQLWIYQDKAFSIFFIEAIGSSIATWYTVKHAK